MFKAVNLVFNRNLMNLLSTFQVEIQFREKFIKYLRPYKKKAPQYRMEIKRRLSEALNKLGSIS